LYSATLKKKFLRWWWWHAECNTLHRSRGEVLCCWKSDRIRQESVQRWSKEDRFSHSGASHCFEFCQ